jgi:hypothetical protein
MSAVERLPWGVDSIDIVINRTIHILTEATGPGPSIPHPEGGVLDQPLHAVAPLAARRRRDDFDGDARQCTRTQSRTIFGRESLATGVGHRPPTVTYAAPLQFLILVVASWIGRPRRLGHHRAAQMRGALRPAADGCVTSMRRQLRRCPERGIPDCHADPRCCGVISRKRCPEPDSAWHPRPYPVRLGAATAPLPPMGTEMPSPFGLLSGKASCEYGDRTRIIRATSSTG